MTGFVCLVCFLTRHKHKRFLVSMMLLRPHDRICKKKRTKEQQLFHDSNQLKNVGYIFKRITNLCLVENLYTAVLWLPNANNVAKPF